MTGSTTKPGDPHGGGQGQIELRQLFEVPELTGDAESLDKEAERGEQVKRRNQSN